MEPNLENPTQEPGIQTTNTVAPGIMEPQSQPMTAPVPEPQPVASQFNQPQLANPVNVNDISQPQVNMPIPAQPISPVATPQSPKAGNNGLMIAMVGVGVIFMLLLLGAGGWFGYSYFVKGLKKTSRNANNTEIPVVEDSEETSGITLTGSVMDFQALDQAYEYAKKQVSFKNSALVYAHAVIKEDLGTRVWSFDFFNKDTFNAGYYKKETIIISNSSPVTITPGKLYVGNVKSTVGDFNPKYDLSEVYKKGKAALLEKGYSLGTFYELSYTDTGYGANAWELVYGKAGEKLVAREYKMRDVYSVIMDAGDLRVEEISTKQQGF